MSDTTLWAIHPEDLGNAGGAAIDLRPFLDEPSGSSSARRPHCLYVTTHAQSRALAAELADRLWLRVELLEAPAAADAVAYLAGAIEQIGRQHAGHALCLIGPRAELSPVLDYLEAHGRLRARGMRVRRQEQRGAA